MQPSDLPRYDDLLWPTLKAIDSLGGSGTNQEINEEIFSDLRLPDEVQSVTYPKSGASVFSDRCSWARSYLKMAKFLTSGGRGVWSLTEEGRQKVETGNETEIRQLVTQAYYQWLSLNRDQDVEDEEISEQMPLSALGNIASGTAPTHIESIDNKDLTWKDRLLAILIQMQPDAFERLCQRLLRESGFTKVEVTGKSGDGGIDGIGVLRVNLVSFHVLFQAKRWQGTVGSAVVRDFRGAMVGRADKGLIITTSTYTRDARIEATRDGAPAIDLIEGEDLCRLLKEASVGVKVKMVEEIEIDSGFFEAV